MPSASSKFEHPVASRQVPFAAAPVDSLVPGVVWIAHPSRALASEVVSRLRSLHLNAKLWDEHHFDARQGGACDLVVADSDGLRLIAKSVNRAAASEAASLRIPCRGGLAPSALRRVQALIEERLAEKLDLMELARLAGLSCCHFSRAFRQSMGMPPHRYILSRRVAVAAGLLERTECPITEIALAVGFADHSHFTRIFVRMVGDTPSAYRRRRR